MRESREAKRARARKIIRDLKNAYPDAKIALHFANPLELVVATILAAQCTDERVNIVTPELFKKYPTARHYARAEPAALEQEIRSTGFFRSKTRSIMGMAKALVDKHGGEVPKTREALTDSKRDPRERVRRAGHRGRHARLPHLPAPGAGALGGPGRDPRPVGRRTSEGGVDADVPPPDHPRAPLLRGSRAALSCLPGEGALPVAGKDQDPLTCQA